MTEDSDFKKLVRERMARTGESYTTARAHLLSKGGAGQPSTDADQMDEPRGGEQPKQFSLGDGSALQQGAEQREAVVGAALGEGLLALFDNHLSVELAGFRAAIPYSNIRAISPVPDKEPGSSLGAHGIRGRWLVNAAYTGLVRLEIAPPIRARLDPIGAIERGRAELDASQEVPRLVRLLLRARSPKVRDLTVSVTERDAFIAALLLRCPAARR